MFRREVLAPHHVRVLDSVAGQSLPESIIACIDTNRKKAEQFSSQRQRFRKQVAAGKGFGSSVLFPQEVLPSLDGQPFLSRCMVPSFSEDALPEKRIGKSQTKSGLSIPRPGLGCGFSSSAFAPEEVNAIPSHLLATGTTVHFETGSITSGTALYCPFLTFERAFSQNENGIDVANNQCAVDGAWCVRALQMLYAKATDEATDVQFDSPVSFSCCIDNDIAVVNFHWVDHAQTYCMGPVVKFDLSRDDHFDHFVLWIDAIGQWAVKHLLPEIKKAISLLSDYVSAVPELVKSLTPYDETVAKEEESILPALKTTYNNIPWRYDNEGFSPVSSSTASWGSPMINEAIFAKFEYPAIPRARSVCSDSLVSRTRFDIPAATAKQIIKPYLVKNAARPAPGRPIAEPAYQENTELVVKKRLGHAMDEIQDLQNQLVQLKQELNGSTTCLQNELSGLRRTMTSVMRKEQSSTTTTQRSPVRTRADKNAWIKNEHRLDVQKSISVAAAVVTTPTDPRPSPFRRSKPRTPSGLQNVLTLDTNVSAVVSSTCSAGASIVGEDEFPSPVTIFSPTIININNNYEDSSSFRVSHHHQPNIWSPVLATHILSSLVPSTMLRVIFLGMVLDYCMLAMTRNYPPTISVYLSHLLENTVY